MARYSIDVKRSAARELGTIPKLDLRRILRRIRSPETEPRPHGCEKLSAQERYRIRQGDYRIVYSVDDAEHNVVVVKIGHRRDVYRR